MVMLDVLISENGQDVLTTVLEQKERLLKLAEQQKAVWQDALTEAFNALESAQSGSPQSRSGLSHLRPSSKPPDLRGESSPKSPKSAKVVTLEEVEEDDVQSEASDEILPSAGPAMSSDSPGGTNSSAAARTRSTRSKFSKAATMAKLLDMGNLNIDIMQLISQYIDYAAGFLVLINSFALMLQLEMEGWQVAGQIGMPGANFEEVLPVFRVVDSVFVFIFFAELLLRVALEKGNFVKDLANWLDTVLVVGGLVDIFVSMNAQSEDVATLRFVTALKAFRAIRMVRSFRFFRGLRSLVKACQCCLPSLCWSMVLLAVFLCMGGLIMGNLLQDFIKDESQSMEDRQWVWQHYGTCYRATYTLYEMTFAGNWPVNARPILEKVSHAFVIFYFLYITIIVFAVIRVISAIFLKDTLDEAHNDAQQMVLDRLKKKADYVQRLEGLFRTIDESGQGMITETRLQEMLDNPKVKAYLQTLEIDVHEGHALFHLLDNGDGEVTLEEFTGGLMRCKGPARAIDAVALHSDLRQLDAKVSKVIHHLKEARLIRSKSKSEKLVARSQAEHMKVFRLDPAEELKFQQQTVNTSMSET